MLVEASNLFNSDSENSPNISSSTSSGCIAAAAAAGAAADCGWLALFVLSIAEPLPPLSLSPASSVAAITQVEWLIL